MWQLEQNGFTLNNDKDNIYDRLGWKEGKNGIYKIGQARERRSKNIDQVRSIKCKDNRILLKDLKIKEW